MPVEVLPDSAAVAMRAADVICTLATAKPRANLGLPTGRTPIPLYEELAKRATNRTCDLSNALVYAIDEFCDAERTSPGTNTQFYREHIRFPTRGVHCPNPASTEPDLHIRAFAEAIRRGRGLDLCVLGIGETGHIAFNEPGSERDSHARVVELTGTSRQAHAASFGGIEKVPHRGTTLGIVDLLASQTIVVLATGADKAEIVRRALAGPIGPDVPASWLREHPNVTWLLDAESGAGVSTS